MSCCLVDGVTGRRARITASEIAAWPDLRWRRSAWLVAQEADGASGRVIIFGLTQLGDIRRDPPCSWLRP